MATQFTTRQALPYWQLNDKSWHVQYAEACAILDGMGSIGPLAVRPTTPGTTARLPSGSLTVNVAAGSYRKISDNTLVTYAGTTGYAVAASSTKHLWLDASGTLQSGTSWPTGISYVRLATVTTDGSHVTAIVDERVVFTQVAG